MVQSPAAPEFPEDDSNPSEFFKDDITPAYTPDSDHPHTIAPESGFLEGGVFATMASAIRRGEYGRQDFEQGTRIHHYRILSELGRGGFGTVFLAEHIYLKQRVALKTLNALRAESNPNSEMAGRFLQEAQALAILNGPHVLRVQDASVFENTPYVVTELLRGCTLSEYLREHQCLTVNQTLDLLEQVGEVLIRQEKFGILHRDLKPSNIWIREDGSFCVLDYGLVGFASQGPAHVLDGEVTQTGQIMGTPAYMAPEQVRGEEFVDHRSDLFGLGITAWTGLAGKTPRNGSTPQSTMVQAATESVPSICDLRPEVPSEVSKVLQSLLAHDKEDRYITASAFIEDLEGYRYGRRRPFGATRGSAFVATPFHASFDPFFDFLQDLCGEAKLAARRIDRVPNMNNIWSQIDKEIRTATVVIAVFSREPWRQSPNANVITEAAHARAIGRPLIVLTTDRAEKLPFDWRHLPVIRYQKSQKGLALLREQLLPRLRQELRDRK